MLTFIFFLILQSASAQVRFAPVEGQYQARGEFQYLTTSANYDSGGSSQSLYGGGKLTRMLGVFEATYDLSPALRFWGGFSGGQTTAVVVDFATSALTNTTVTKTLTNSGMSEAWLGAQWWTEFNKLDVVPQADFTFPFSRVDTTSTTPLLGEGAIRFQGGATALYPLESVTPFVYGGMAYRDGGRSMLFPYSIGARYGTESDWWIQGEFRGYQSMTDNSTDYDRSVRDTYLRLSDGGSYEFYGMNPSRSEVAAMLGVRFNQVTAYGGGSKSVFGRNSADDYEIRVGFLFNGFVNGAPSRLRKTSPGAPPSNPQRPPPAPGSPPDDGFREDGAKYDESLFEEQVTPKPVAEPEVVITPPKPKPKPKPRPPKQEAPMPNVELLMKDTEKTLERRKGQ